MAKIKVKMVITDVDGEPKDEVVEVVNWDARHPNDFKLDHPDYKYFQFSSGHSKTEYNDDWYVEKGCQYDGYLISGKMVYEAVVLFQKANHA